MEEDEVIQQFNVIFAKYHNDIYRFLMKLTNYDPYLAEDITQETFYRVYLGIDKFKGQCHIKTWICGIAKNTYYSHLRKNKKTDSLNVSSSKCHLEDTYKKASINSIEEVYENKEMIRVILKIIASFKEVNQNVMVYRIFFNMPYSEISQLLKISEASAKVIYYRSKMILKDKLRKEYEYEI